MNNPTLIAICLALGVCVLCFIVAIVLTLKKKEDDIRGMQDAYSYLRRAYDNSLKNINEINSRYSASLDERERFVNETTIRIKKLEMEIDAKNAEIDRLNRRIAVVELPVDIAKITEVNHEEKEA